EDGIPDRNVTGVQTCALPIFAAQQAAQETISGGYDNSVVNGGSINATADDVTLLAAIIQCEAYQNYDYLLAVATVIMNRVEDPQIGRASCRAGREVTGERMGT